MMIKAVGRRMFFQVIAALVVFAAVQASDGQVRRLPTGSVDKKPDLTPKLPKIRKVRPAAPVDPEIDAVINREMIRQHIIGVAVGVYEKGEIKHLAGHGFHGFKKGTPVTTGTVFRWASVSKPLTAVAALQCMEAGIFRTGDFISDLVDYWPDRGDQGKVKVWHLLTNRSGISHYGDGAEEADDNKYKYDKSKYSSPRTFDGKQAADVFSMESEMDFEPGRKFLYSTFGFNLMGSVIDTRAGGFERWVQRRIATPLGLTSLRASTTPRFGYFFTKQGVIKKSASESNVIWKLGGGGFESNIRDLTQFGVGIVEGKLLKNTERLWFGFSSYRRGFEVTGTDDDLAIYHSGRHARAASSHLRIYPKRDIVIAVLSNNSWLDGEALALRIAETMGLAVDVGDEPVIHRDKGEYDETLTALWRKTGESVIFRRGYPHDRFLDLYKQMRAAGYVCADFEAWRDGETLRWDGVFVKSRRPMAMWRGQDFDGFKKKWREMNERGLRLVDLETFRVGKTRRWAGLFEKRGDDKYAIHRDKTTKQFGAIYKALSEKGHRLIDIEAYVDEGQLRWAGVWLGSGRVLLNRHYTFNDFHVLNRERLQGEWRLFDVEGYNYNGRQYWAGIWEKSDSGAPLRRNIDFKEFKTRAERLNGSGYQLIDWEP